MTTGTVAVLMGGWSEEREISLQSGACVLEALHARGIDARGIDLRCAAELTEEQLDGCDRVFLALHGTGGEDGEAQTILERLDCAYTGSSADASALCMDKTETKRLWQRTGIPTPSFSEWKTGEAVPEEGSVSLPVVAKPAAQGSSIGVVVVHTQEELAPALAEAERHAPDGRVLLESLIQGEEYTASVLDGTTLPMIRLRPNGTLYDYHAKYEAPDTEYLVPCGLPEPIEEELLSLCFHAFEATGARGYGRVDLIVDELDRPWFLEVNTLPGLRHGSLLPRAAAACGMGYEDVVLHILKTASRPSAGGSS